MLLGKLLLQLRLVTPVQLDAALRAQVAHGGRLGTNLLRLGYIEPDSLTAALAKQLEVRGVSLQRLNRLDELTLKRLPPSVARRHRTLPLGLIEEAGHRSLCAAFIDPHDLASVDEVAFACGLPVIPFVAPELCIQTFLDQYYPMENEEPLPERAAAPPPAAKPAADRPSPSAGTTRGGGGPVVPLRPAQEGSPRAPSAQGSNQFWAGQSEMPQPMRGRSATQGFRTLSHPEARSLEQALRVAGEAPPADVSPAEREPLWAEQTPMYHPGMRREEPPDRPRRPSPQGPQRPSRDPIRYGAANPVEEAKRPPYRVTSDIELDAPRRFREDDFNLPTPQPRVRELDEDALSTAVLGQSSAPGGRLVRQPSEEVDLSELERTGQRTWGDAAGQDGAARALGATRPAPNVRPRPALSLDEVVRCLRETDSREEVGDLVTDCLRSAFGCGLVFICRDELCLGWKGFAAGVAPAVIESIVLPLATPSLFRVAYQRGSIFRGAPPRDGQLVHQRLWKLIGVDPPEEVVVAPVRIGQRVVNLVYAHAFDRGGLPDTAVVEVSELVKGMQEAFMRLIKTKKRA